MRVFLAGASGALGSRLVPQLIDAGHDVIGTHNSPARADLVQTLGAKPVLLDLLDAPAVHAAVVEHEPEAIVHQATAFAGVKFSRNLDKTVAKSNELRTKGTDALLTAAREAGVRRFVAQSGAAADGTIEPVRKRQFPIVGDGSGIWSWIHLDDAAAATVLALEHDGPAIYNVVDDEPAPVRDWLPVLAQALGAKPPRRFPTWLGRLFAGEAVTVMATEARGASNAKAKRELGWTLRYPSWRQGFAASYARLGTADAPTPRSAPRPGHSPG